METASLQEDEEIWAELSSSFKPREKWALLSLLRNEIRGFNSEAVSSET